MENQPSPKTNHRSRGVTHHIAQRTRYRIARKHRDAKTLRRVNESIMKVPGVKKVELNERTGSILVHHEENPGILPLLGTVLDELGVDLFEGLVGGEEMILIPGLSVISGLVKTKFGSANNSVSELTKNYLDLKTLVPMLFLGAGFYQASQNRYWWKQMPAWVLFYYAFDSYLKFHGAGNYLPAQGSGNGHNNLGS